MFLGFKKKYKVSYFDYTLSEHVEHTLALIL